MTCVPSSDSARQVRSPASVSGTFTATLGAMPRRYRPSASIGSNSVAVTSAETGPGVMEQISAITSAILRPDLAIRLGLVVTPSTRPVSASERISATSAVSTKNFMGRVSSAAGGRAFQPSWARG